MIVVRTPDEIKETEGLVATIGFFDGVHRGHRRLIEQMQDIARQRRLPSAVVTFPQHPRIALHADYQPKLLNSFPEKLTHLATTGIDYCIVLDFTEALSRLTAEDFITTVLARRWNVKTLLIGYDHRFGRDRADGFQQYAAYAQACGMDVVQATPFVEDEVAVSSSEVRKQLTAGYVEQAARLLAYPYQLKGQIVHGNHIGRTLGFPTANIRIDEPKKILPPEGVYAVEVTLDDKTYKGMLYNGRRPTLDGDGGQMRIEVHIFDFAGDIYARPISVAFLRYIRADIRFRSLEELKEQLERDKDAILANA
ncbi:MAG: riboflavin biosynthesis protein RibF [Tannerellaceae bacterium]|jgi:riboflavin kinase/FMN adenylyltransferase|nr:riboflavin biosynthesis protein RibF [Tannerellaceae bacterium]